MVIKPITDLENYSEILRDVDNGNTVYLTREGRGAYFIADMDTENEYKRALAMNKLLTELNKAHASGESKGWIPMDKMLEKYGVSPDEL